MIQNCDVSQIIEGDVLFQSLSLLVVVFNSKNMTFVRAERGVYRHDFSAHSDYCILRVYPHLSHDDVSDLFSDFLGSSSREEISESALVCRERLLVYDKHSSRLIDAAVDHVFQAVVLDRSDRL